MLSVRSLLISGFGVEVVDGLLARLATAFVAGFLLLLRFNVAATST